MKRILSTLTVLALCALAAPAFAGRAKKAPANAGVKAARNGNRPTVAKLNKEVQELKAQVNQLQQQLRGQEQLAASDQITGQGQVIEEPTLQPEIVEPQPELVNEPAVVTPETYYQAPGTGGNIVRGPVAGAGRLAEDAVIGAGEVAGGAVRAAEDVALGAVDVATAPFRAL